MTPRDYITAILEGALHDALRDLEQYHAAPDSDFDGPCWGSLLDGYYDARRALDWFQSSDHGVRA